MKNLPADRTAITCHDVLAIRGALGDADAHCPASRPGKMLQKWILGHLSRAGQIACVSQFTLRQLQALAGGQQNDWRVIPNAFNADFRPMAKNKREALLAKVGLAPGVPFLLHVGSGLPRKNRKLLLDMVAALGNRWAGRLCLAGEAPDERFLAHAQSLGLSPRITWVKPDHATLVALYSGCEALVFPSFSEGFGWPIIEAQACGAPVLASHLEPLPEVSGGAALHLDPSDPIAFAEAFRSLADDRLRERLIQEGFANARRFEPVRMIQAYLTLHGVVLLPSQSLCS